MEDNELPNPKTPRTISSLKNAKYHKQKNKRIKIIT